MFHNPDYAEVRRIIGENPIPVDEIPVLKQIFTEGKHEPSMICVRCFTYGMICGIRRERQRRRRQP